VIERKNVTWDLARASEGHILNVYWSEPDPFRSRWAPKTMTLLAQNGPWQPWQIDGVVAAVKAGREPGYGMVPRVEPGTPGWKRAARTFERGLFGALDKLLGSRSMAGNA
jgi:hypothetical protein